MPYLRRRRAVRTARSSYFGGFDAHATAAEHGALAGGALIDELDELDPVPPIAGDITRSFWGRAWCANLESHGEWAERMPRGRSYVRNGSVLDLRVSRGRVDARVQGTFLYFVSIRVERVGKLHWRNLIAASRGDVRSPSALLAGAVPRQVLEALCHRDRGVLPAPHEIAFTCSCPERVAMCKHVAATLYGVGARLDERPELLFLLRSVDHRALVDLSADGDAAPVDPTVLDAAAIEEMLGIQVDADRVLSTRAENALPSTTLPVATSQITRQISRKRSAATARKSAAPPKGSARAKKSTTPKKPAPKRRTLDTLEQAMRDAIASAFLPPKRRR
ncbi:MAG: hypothetical protein HYV09_20925 [Deltaproteobacteria bacterium]|nr:hypothetical protein [Deltaproteobacteria bacterium]